MINRDVPFDIEKAVRAQAKVRVILGPIVMGILYLISIFLVLNSVILSSIFYITYLLYNIAIFYLVKTFKLFSAVQIAYITTVLDMLMLSMMLSIGGQYAGLFVCFYLFTIMGFGFRIGIRYMQICHISSVIGLLIMLFTSEIWRQYPIIGFSYLMVLIVVPLYATGLLKQLHSSRLKEHQHAIELEDVNKQLASKNDELIIVNAELAAVNKELESFSYSVSHDLRAPLRGIDSFMAILLKDYKDKLDQVGQNYMERIRAAVQRMSLLIDDLLKLSHLGKMELNFTDINMSEIAESIAKDLKDANPKRVAYFKIEPNLIIKADITLLRIILENLIGNAWKYSGKHAETNIEIGSMPNKRKRIGNNSMIYYVKDDGAGFDMKYADKLFGTFQRLHSPKEFEGTGIGLSNVFRAVKRLGGDIWVESEVEKGATFYFTLNNK